MTDIHRQVRDFGGQTAEQRIAELEAELAATKKAALNLADANTRKSHVVLDLAKKLHAESDPRHVESERQANAILTDEIESLQRAVEHGRYLATAAEEFIASISEADRLSILADESADATEQAKAADDFLGASDKMSDCLQGLKNCMYEFTKRADRAMTK